MKIDPIEFYQDLGVEVVKESKEGFSPVSMCPFCQKKRKSGVILHGKNKGSYNCFSGSCQTKGNFAYIYSLIKEVSREEAEVAIYGERRGAGSRVSIEFSDTKNASIDLPPARDFNSFFKEISEGSFSYEYIISRGYKKEDFDHIPLYEVAASKEDLWNQIKDSLTDDQKKCISAVKEVYYQTEDVSEEIFLERLSDRFDLEDIQLGRELLEASRLCARLIIPSFINGGYYGYVARAIHKDQQPKTINSTGGFSNFAIGNFDVVKNKEKLVINEGFFDSLSIGHDACYLYGKIINPKSTKVALLKLLSPKETFIYLDVGAEEDSLKLYEEIVLNHDKVHIVSPPEFIESRLEGSVAEILLKNKLIKRSRDFDRDGFRVSYKEWLSLKMIKSFGNSPRNAKSFLKRMGRTSAFKNDVFKRYQANSSLFSTLIADLVGFVQDHDYIDAGDLIGHNDGIIDSCRIEFSINSYKIAHDLA
jgi:hypothetical protein